MPTFNLNLSGDRSWPDLEDKKMEDKLIHLPDGAWNIAVIPGGMASGRPSIALRLDLPDGKVVVTETSLQAWVAATAAMRARYPEPFAGTPLEETEHVRRHDRP